MFIRLGGRCNGKSYQLLCEQINELQLKIEFAKKFGLPYKKEEQYLNTLYKKLDGGRDVKEKQNKTNKSTNTKKYEN